MSLTQNLQIFGLLIIFAISLAALILAVFNFIKINNVNEPFETIGDAYKTGWYQTFGHECHPSLYKCMVNNKNQNHYFCSANPNCEISYHNVKGKLLKEPLTWFQRFV